MDSGKTNPGAPPLSDLWIQRTMSNSSPLGRGRRKFVEKFTSRQGFWLLGIVAVIMMGMMLLILLGYVNVDMD
jgi:hypothetical protein